MESSDASDATGSSLFWNLMMADLLQAIACLPSIRWMLDGVITEGSLCTAQAVIQQFGVNGAALSQVSNPSTFQCSDVLILSFSGPLCVLFVPDKYLYLI